MAVGAPLGWLLIQAVRGVHPLVELREHPVLLLYLLVATMIVFALFGRALGEQEDRLLRANRNLEQLAITDALTGLHNARYFHARMAEEEAEHKRTGAPLAIVIIDLDHFKRVNDTYGHLTGDDVLSAAARALESVTRHGETVARVGGEEFGLLLPGSTSVAALEVAERAREAIRSARVPVPDVPGKFVTVTASAGVASTSDMPGAGAEELLRAADEMLYAAKQEGRDRSITTSRLRSVREGGT